MKTVPASWALYGSLWCSLFAVGSADAAPAGIGNSITDIAHNRLIARGMPSAPASMRAVAPRIDNPPSQYEIAVTCFYATEASLRPWHARWNAATPLAEGAAHIARAYGVDNQLRRDLSDWVKSSRAKIVTLPRIMPFEGQAAPMTYYQPIDYLAPVKPVPHTDAVVEYDLAWKFAMSAHSITAPDDRIALTVVLLPQTRLTEQLVDGARGYPLAAARETALPVRPESIEVVLRDGDAIILRGFGPHLLATNLPGGALPADLPSRVRDDIEGTHQLPFLMLMTVQRIPRLEENEIVPGT